MPFTVAQRNSILNKILRNTDFTPDATIYVSLHTGDPGDTGANEVTGGTYGRQSCAFDAAASNHTQNTSVINFTLMPAITNPNYVTHFGLWSAASGGTFRGGGAMTANKETNAGDTYQVAAGDLDITLT